MATELPYEFGTATNTDRLFTTQLQEDLDALVAAIDGGITQLKTGFISEIISTPQNKDYRIIEKIPFGCTLTSFTAKLTSGTLTATLKIGSTAVTDGALNVTSTQQTATPSALNTMVIGDLLVITISAVSSPVDLSYTVVFTRVLP